ncbi:MAG TPA: hypothetical protein VMR62_30760 [Bryobacteraceae bacterium]|nr:hypothetical protein [Bryobacteraceae bacterium]
MRARFDPAARVGLWDVLRNLPRLYQSVKPIFLKKNAAASIFQCLRTERVQFGKRALESIGSIHQLRASHSGVDAFPLEIGFPIMQRQF